MAEHLSSEAHFSYSAAANGHEFNHPQAPHTETVSAIGSISLELIGQPERIDKPEEILKLEREYQALEYIKSQYALENLDSTQRALAPLTQPMHYVEEIGNQFAKKIVPAYMHPSAEEGLAMFREIKPHTTEEEMVLLVTDKQFTDIHEGVLEHLEASQEKMIADVEKRLSASGPMALNDRLQFRGKETKNSLANVLRNGIDMSVSSDSVEELKRLVECSNCGSIPITEQVKNLRLITVSGFPNSKISHAAHDVMDHAWTFDLLQKKGYLEDYADLLQSIGNPHRTNIFLREGEAIASIAYGVRYWSMVEPGFRPLMRCLDLAKRMDDYFDSGTLTDERHLRAYKIIRQLAKDPSAREAQSLGFSFSNYYTELDEQRRKQGKIKQKSLISGQVIGELDPLSPDFLSLFIETHHEVLSSRNKHRNDLFVFHIIMEEFLNGIGTGDISSDTELNVRVQDLRTRDMSQVKLPAERLHWMFRNYGFTSTKDSIY